jgi:hypothetical protein
MAVRTRLRAQIAVTGAAALAAILAGVLLGGCAGNPVVLDWQDNVKSATRRSTVAYLVGDSRTEASELERARSEAARTGRAELLARIELTRCASHVASLSFGPCTAFEPLRPDVGAPERVYADYLDANIAPADISLLPQPHQALAAGGSGRPANVEALAAIKDPLTRLVAAGVLFEAGRADGQVISVAIDTASSQGWRRPLLAWLGVQLRRAELADAAEDAQKLRRRIALVEGGIR